MKGETKFSWVKHAQHTPCIETYAITIKESRVEEKHSRATRSVPTFKPRKNIASLLLAFTRSVTAAEQRKIFIEAVSKRFFRRRGISIDRTEFHRIKF